MDRGVYWSTTAWRNHWFSLKHIRKKQAVFQVICSDITSVDLWCYSKMIPSSFRLEYPKSGAWWTCELRNMFSCCVIFFFISCPQPPNHCSIHLPFRCMCTGIFLYHEFVLNIKFNSICWACMVVSECHNNAKSCCKTCVLLQVLTAPCATCWTKKISCMSRQVFHGAEAKTKQLT